MTEKRIRQIYGIVLSVVVIVAGICLLVQCLNIYRSGGEQTFTAEKVAGAFAPIALPVYLAIAMGLGGFLLHFLLPGEKLKLKLGKNEPLILKKLHEKFDYTLCEDGRLRSAVEKEQRTRKLHTAIAFGLLGIGAVVFLIYGTNPANFHQHQINDSMVKAMIVLLPCMAVPFGYGIFAAYHNRASIRAEIKLMKLVGAPRTQPVAAASNRDKTVQILRYAIACVAVGLLLYGFLLGGWLDVLTKAVNICTECVGLG